MLNRFNFQLSESFHSSDAPDARHSGTTGTHGTPTARSIDGVGCGSNIDYGANGGIEPTDAPNKAYEARPGEAVGVGSNVKYETAVKVPGAPGAAAGRTVTTEHVCKFWCLSNFVKVY